MARSIRIQYSGAFYHVMARGNRRERIFRDDDDRRFFCLTLGNACEKTGYDDSGKRCPSCPIKGLCASETRWLIELVPRSRLN